MFDLLDQRVAAGSTKAKTIQGSINKALKLIELLEKEGLSDYFARAYHLAVTFHLRKGDLLAAKEWAKKELKIHKLASFDSPEIIAALERCDELDIAIKSLQT